MRVTASRDPTRYRAEVDCLAAAELPVTLVSGDRRLPGWRLGVGAPVALDAPVVSGTGATWRGRLLVLTWNLWIGRGRLVEVVARVRAAFGAKAPDEPEPPLLILAQEAFRADQSVPPVPRGSTARDFSTRFLPEHDIRAAAGELGMTLRYVPSMRNAAHRSDRGNAILSTLPLADAWGWELPFVLQRRVALGATVCLPDGRPLRVASAHLDPRGLAARDVLGVAGRALQTRTLLRNLLDASGPGPTLLGADLNLARGRREPAFRLLDEAGFRHGVPERSPAWRHTYHRMPRLILDWALARDPDDAIAHLDTVRLDEHPQDRGPYVFGSDHHPLLTEIIFARPGAAA
jgi:endonuclease/exonuclease/phosphatase family metal-dependent hydrolase